MLRGLLLGAAIYGSLASASTSTSFSSTSVATCTYKSGSGGIPPTPIPTKETRKTITKTETRDAVTVKSTITVNAPAVTVTQRTAIAYTDGVDTVTIPTFTVGFGTERTVATGTFAATVCAGGAKPVTVTKYTGTYTPISGQSTAIPATYPTEAICSTGETIFYILSPTVTSGSTTITVTPTTTVTSPTTTSTSTIIFGTSLTYLTTVTTTVTTYTPDAVTKTSTVPCTEATVTRTMAAQCAPTNIVANINDEGLQSGRYADRTSVIYTLEEPWANDASACCQACLDNEGCGASMGGGGGCGLYYTATEDGEPVCDAFIFSFTSTPDVLPGQGLLMANGCGTIEYQS